MLDFSLVGQTVGSQTRKLAVKRPLSTLFNRGLLEVFRDVSGGVLHLLQLRLSRSLAIGTDVLLGRFLSNIRGSLAFVRLFLQSGDFFLGLGNVLKVC